MNRVIIAISSMASLIVIVVVLVACEDGTPYSEFDYYREGQLKNVFRNEILPKHELFEAQSLELKNASENFSKQPNEINLEALRVKWCETIKSWKRCELYNLGPIAETFIQNQINKWPIDETKVESYIAGNETINEEFITSRGSNAKGLTAIEYLLFKGQQDVSTVQSGFTDQRRLNYLMFLVSNVYDLSREINGLWPLYQSEFETQTSGGLDGGQNALINNLVSLLEEIVQIKIGDVSGNQNGGVPSPEHSESFHGQASLELIRANLESVERCYDGEFARTAFRVGFKEFLELSGNTELSDRVKAQIEACHVAIDNISVPLNKAVETDSVAVAALYEEFRNLLVLVKVDLANVLGSIITFTDNDGD